MINDGVCDEATNIERCLFDGNDCCQANKSREFCKVCSCKKRVDLDAIIFKAKQLQVQTLTTKHAIPLSQKFSASFEDVASHVVCTVLCLEKSEENELDFNLWTFNGTDNLCTCLIARNIKLHHGLSLSPFEIYVKTGSLPHDEMAVFISQARILIKHYGTFQ